MDTFCIKQKRNNRVANEPNYDASINIPVKKKKKKNHLLTFASFHVSFSHNDKLHSCCILLFAIFPITDASAINREWDSWRRKRGFYAAMWRQFERIPDVKSAKLWFDVSPMTGCLFHTGWWKPSLFSLRKWKVKHTATSGSLRRPAYMPRDHTWCVGVVEPQRWR